MSNIFIIRLRYYKSTFFVADIAFYRVGHKSLTTLCKSQSMRNRWITTICDLIRPREKSIGGVTLTAAIL
jgi:hypothetical protein